MGLVLELAPPGSETAGQAFKRWWLESAQARRLRSRIGKLFDLVVVGLPNCDSGARAEAIERCAARMKPRLANRAAHKALRRLAGERRTTPKRLLRDHYFPKALLLAASNAGDSYHANEGAKSKAGDYFGSGWSCIALNPLSWSVLPCGGHGRFGLAVSLAVICFFVGLGLVLFAVADRR